MVDLDLLTATNRHIMIRENGLDVEYGVDLSRGLAV